MRTHAPLVAVALAAFVALTGCAPVSDAEPVSEAAQTPAPERRDSTPEPMAEPADTVAAPPQACVDYEDSKLSGLMTPPAGSEDIKAAADAVVLAPNIVFKPGIQIITSTEVPGSFEAVARICSDPLPEDEFRNAATAIAVAIKQSPSSDLLEVLKVTSMSPDLEGVLQRGAVLSTNYQTYTWDASTSGVPLNKNWTWS